MLQKYVGYLIFRIDPAFSPNIRRGLDTMLDEIRAESASFDQDDLLHRNKLIIELVSENSLHLVVPRKQKVTICILESNQGLFSFGQNLEESAVNAILDETVDLKQLTRIITPYLTGLLDQTEAVILQQAHKNLKKLESKSRSFTQKFSSEKKILDSDKLLQYAQQLVDLEKELIQADDVLRLEKILRHFIKTNMGHSHFQLYTGANLWKLPSGPDLLPLPGYKNEFLTLELNWDDTDSFGFLKKIFFYQTLISFLLSKHDIQDAFFDEKLWEGVLDSIPFPVALLSTEGEVYQHNSLFSKLNFTPLDCLKLKLREKVVIADIPYNIFRKKVHHLDEEKFLFVFFTESFFLKGEGNLTPSGQELGIISSSIAHELNNPIAGIQAAITVLMLEEDANDEAGQTLQEMKNGATRCKQLIETFLGFSRANPISFGATDSRSSAVLMCYQQAQNLLRFRTVESGIRFSFEYSRHTEFKAEVNLSLLTMTFYLILGELMTLFSHQLLVSNKNQIEKVIRGEIIESSQEIQIQLLELNIATLSLSKLIQNLLKIENFVLQVSDYSLRFIYSPARDA